MNPLNVFISGGPGVGKLYLITIFHTLTRTFNLYSGTREEFKVLKMAASCVVTVKVITINTALGIPTIKGNDITKLRDKVRCKLHLIYSELEAVIIGEISMVSNIRLYQTHCRLCEIFSVCLEILFAGLTVILLGDLYQLSPVQGKRFLHLFIII